MEKKLEKGIAIIRNLAQKYKKTILQRLNPKTQKSINKKKKKKKKQTNTFKNLQRKQNGDRKGKEEKMKKLNNYLINQENELDFQENYSLFNKFNAISDDLFYNPQDDKMATHLISKKVEGKNGESKDTPGKANYIDSLNSLKFKIKQEIQENNDLLFLQRRKKLRQSSKERLEGNSSWGSNRIATPGNHPKRALKKSSGSNNDNEQIDEGSTKMKKRRNGCEAERCVTAKCEQTCSDFPPLGVGGKDKGENPPPLPVNSGQIIDDAFFQKDELLAEGESNTLVFGKSKFESINKIVEVSRKEKERGKNGRMGEAEEVLSAQFIQQSRKEHPILSQLGESCVDDFFKEDESDQDNMVTSEQNDCGILESGGSRLRTASPDDLGHLTESAQGGKAGGKNVAAPSDANPELDFFLNGATPLKEDNCFDLFFNEPMATPTIFQGRRH
ncbi:conserved Plasmodium protein, unknown function [Plasmodium vivax]|uniref:Uncharacterized protein n=2 Tax=Plasmodium vivax TaxID=5855 RepID=A0A0J9T4A2_PLAVI|nr:hypothetical protein PVMG_03500 [Plasmodium vivax Mauritania I]CAG9472482.1 unnamed protein product [Plasmodium vivax]SCO75655.1 conserved Plasmodium protein, unknown function [Plasmodium vivax]VUZ99111.1 conserved Plasmodium protein, unknown function [Plasmodium vivax]